MPRVYISGESHGTSSTSAELTVTQAVREALESLTPEQRGVFARLWREAEAGLAVGGAMVAMTGERRAFVGAIVVLVGAEMLRDRPWVTRLGARTADALRRSRDR